MILFCTCGHGEEKHKRKIFDPSGQPSRTVCEECVENYYKRDYQLLSWEFIHPFKLDNLKLIEDIAKEKGLC